MLKCIVLMRSVKGHFKMVMPLEMQLLIFLGNFGFNYVLLIVWVCDAMYFKII